MQFKNIYGKIIKYIIEPQGGIKMEIIRTILTVIYFIIAIVVIVLALIQTKDDPGLSSTMITSSIVFAILTVVLGILYIA